MSEIGELPNGSIEVGVESFGKEVEDGLLEGMRLGVLENNPEVEKFEVEEKGRGVLMKIKSRDRYEIKYVVRRAEREDYPNGMMEYADSSFVCDEFWVNGVETLSNLKSLSGEEIKYFVDLESDHLDEMPADLCGNDNVSRMARGIYMYFPTSDSNGYGDKRMVKTPLVTGDYGLMTFAHEVGHLLGTQDSFKEEIKESLGALSRADSEDKKVKKEEYLRVSGMNSLMNERDAHAYGLAWLKSQSKEMGLSQKNLNSFRELVHIGLLGHERMRKLRGSELNFKEEKSDLKEVFVQAFDMAKRSWKEE